MALYQHRFQGTCASGDSFGFAWWSDSTSNLSTAQDGAVAWAAALWAGAVAGSGWEDQITSGVVLNRVATSLINMADGKQTAIAETTVSQPGVAIGDALPADVALVVSLRTDLANRSGRGRFYLPQPAALTLTTDGKYDSALATTLCDSLEAAWQGYTTVGSPVVYSRTMRAIQPVVSFDVGDLFDSQRRRENGLSETRVSRQMP